jgi:hypothetical protein
MQREWDQTSVSGLAERTRTVLTVWAAKPGAARQPDLGWPPAGRLGNLKRSILTDPVPLCDVAFLFRPVRRGVSKGVEDGRRPTALQAGHPRNNHKAILGLVHPQGMKGWAWRQGETLGSPWIPLAIGACFSPSFYRHRPQRANAL